jgi:hypothetical protein
MYTLMLDQAVPPDGPLYCQVRVGVSALYSKAAPSLFCHFCCACATPPMYDPASFRTQPAIARKAPPSPWLYCPLLRAGPPTHLPCAPVAA